MTTSLFEGLSLGELLAVVASEASEHPFVGSDIQKAAWDEIKKRYRILELENSRLITLAYTLREHLDPIDRRLIEKFEADATRFAEAVDA